MRDNTLRAGDRWRLTFGGAWYALLILCRLATGRCDPSVTPWRLVRAFLKRRVHGELALIQYDDGCAYLASLPPGLISDIEGESRLRLFEDGTPLGPAHAVHDEIRKIGEGRFSHWDTGVLFSTSDNSDPRTNGRTYTFAE